MAASNGCHTVCSALISRGASVSVKNRKDVTPLLIAVKEGHWAVAERLIQNHAAIEQLDETGRTPLMLAAAEGHLGLIDLLLDKGGNLPYNFSPVYNRSSFFWGESDSCIASCTQRIEKG